jgi:hypothetical protein
VRSRVLHVLGGILLLGTACGVRVTDPGTAHDTMPDAATDAPADATMIDAPPPCDGSGQAQSGSGACFTFSATPLDFAAAGSACAATGEHLAIINDGSDQALVFGLVGSATIAFLGGSELAVQGKWVWTDGVQFWNGASGGSGLLGVFADFGSGEPNNGGGEFLEQCLTMRGDLGGVWDDRPCNSETGDTGAAGQDAVVNPYVCERP